MDEALKVIGGVAVLLWVVFSFASLLEILTTYHLDRGLWRCEV